MTDGNYTHIVVVADRSGSMGLAADGDMTRGALTTKGVRSLMKDQRGQPGKLTVSLTEFDTLHNVVEDFGDGALAQQWSCSPRGGTALYDALGTMIASTGERLAALPEGDRPGKVIVVIATDGEENSSQEYVTGQQVKDMIDHQRDVYGWEFVYIGVDNDAFTEAAKIGVNAANTVAVAAAATAQSYLTTSENMTRYRSGAAQSMAYTPEQKNDLSK